MPKLKTDIAKLHQLHGQGLGVTEMAKELGVSKGTVSKQLKKLNLNVIKQGVHVARKIADKKDEVTDHLMFLVDKAKTELDWIESTVPPKDDSEYRAWQDQKIKFAAELRKTIGAISDIAYKMFQASEVKEILQIIDEEIGYESPECQKRIRERIQRRRDIRFAVSINE
jgi:DNA-binding transcriptional regulator GbsR (MarR family)